jgi:hypothetical protein
MHRYKYLRRIHGSAHAHLILIELHRHKSKVDPIRMIHHLIRISPFCSAVGGDEVSVVISPPLQGVAGSGDERTAQQLASLLVSLSLGGGPGFGASQVLLRDIAHVAVSNKHVLQGSQEGVAGTGTRAGEGQGNTAAGHQPGFSSSSTVPLPGVTISGSGHADLASSAAAGFAASAPAEAFNSAAAAGGGSQTFSGGTAFPTASAGGGGAQKKYSPADLQRRLLAEVGLLDEIGGYQQQLESLTRIQETAEARQEAATMAQSIIVREKMDEEDKAKRQAQDEKFSEAQETIMSSFAEQLKGTTDAFIDALKAQSEEGKASGVEAAMMSMKDEHTTQLQSVSLCK